VSIEKPWWLNRKDHITAINANTMIGHAIYQYGAPSNCVLTPHVRTCSEQENRVMSIWEHKSAHDIARAVDIHIKKGAASAKSQYGHHIVGVFRDAKRASVNALTGPKELDEIRAGLCYACRGDALYECDVAYGWSPQCEFIRQSQ
jgi:hypothetical protein